MSAQLADLLAQRRGEQLEQAAVASEVVIARDTDNAQGVLGIAWAKHADLLMVGVKPADLVRHKTADGIQDAANRSVLFIPLPSQGKSWLMD